MLDRIITQLTNNDPALTELDISSIPSARDEVVTFPLKLLSALKKNQYLTYLKLTNEHYNVGGDLLKAILSVLETNTSLTTLDLSENDIDAEDAEHIANLLAVNTSLTTLYLDENYIGEKGLASIVKALIANKNTHLKTLGLYRNRIGDEGAEAIAKLLEEPSCLTVLDVGYNQISDKGAALIAKALEKNTQLEELNLYLNQICSEGARALAIALENNPNTQLKVLELGRNEIRIEGAKAIAGMLTVNTSLTCLDLYDNGIGDEGAKAIAGALTKNTHLEALNLRYNGIGDEGAKVIAEMLATNTTLTTLDLYNNQIGDEGIKAIAGAVKKNACLKELDLGFNKIGTEGAQAIAEMLAENSHLEVLRLAVNYGPGIGQEGLKAIAESLKNNQHLKTLDISRRELGDEGAKTIAGMLMVNTTLTTLNLVGKDIGEEGLKALAEAMEKNTQLTELKVASHSIGDVDIPLDIRTERLACLQAIEKCLKRNKNRLENIISRLELNDPALKELDLDDQEIDIKTLNRIAEALKKNTYLKKLNLDDCHIGEKGAQILAQALEKNKGLKKLFLGSNEIGDEGAKAFAEMLKVNTSLTVLDIVANNIGKKGARAIAGAISENSSLQYLGINNNQMGDEGAEAIALAIEENTSLTHIYLGVNGIGIKGKGEAALTASLENNTHLLVLNFADHNYCEHCGNRFRYLQRNEDLLKEKNQSLIVETKPSEVNIPNDNIIGSSIDETLLEPTSSPIILPKEIPNEIPKTTFFLPRLEKLDLHNQKINREENPSVTVQSEIPQVIDGIVMNVTMDFFTSCKKPFEKTTHQGIEGHIATGYRVVGAELDASVSPILLDGSIDETVLQEQIKQAVLAKQPIVVYFQLTSEHTEVTIANKSSEIRKAAINDFSTYQENSLGLTITTVASPLSFENFAKQVSSPSSKDKIPDKNNVGELQRKTDISKNEIFINNPPSTILEEDQATKAKYHFKSYAIYRDALVLQKKNSSFTYTHSEQENINWKTCAKRLEFREGGEESKPVLINGFLDEPTLKAQIRAAHINLRPTVIYFSMDHRDIQDEFREKFSEKTSEFANAKWLLALFDTKPRLPRLEINFVAGELPFEVFSKTISSEVITANALLEQDKNIVIPEEKRPERFPWDKLALILVVVGLGGVIGLAVAGLFLSLWAIIPAAVLLIGVGVGIKSIYDRHQQNQSIYKNDLPVPDENDKSTLLGDKEELSILSLDERKEPQVVNVIGKSEQIKRPGQKELFSTEKKASIVSIENSEAMQKAERAKSIIIGKINEFIQHQKEELTITSNDDTVEFTLEAMQKCFSDMENELTIFEEEGDYVLRWDVIVPSKAIKNTTFAALPSDALDRTLLLIMNVINRSLEGDDFAVCDRFSPQRRTRIRYLNSVFIASQSIEKIIQKYPDDQLKQNRNH